MFSVLRVSQQVTTSTQNTPNFSFWSFFFHLLSSHHHSHHRHMTRDSIQILLFFSRSILSCCCHHRDYSLYLSVFENVNRVIYLVYIRFTVEFGSDLEHSRTEVSHVKQEYGWNHCSSTRSGKCDVVKLVRVPCQG